MLIVNLLGLTTRLDVQALIQMLIQSDMRLTCTQM